MSLTCFPFMEPIEEDPAGAIAAAASFESGHVSNVILADDCFLGCTIDVVDENALSYNDQDDFADSDLVSLDDDDFSRMSDEVLAGGDRMADPFLDDTLDDAAALQQDRRSAARADASAASGRMKMPKFRIRIRPEDGRPPGKKAPKQKTLVYLDDLPEVAKNKRGPRGPYRKRTDKPNVRPKALRRPAPPADHDDLDDEDRPLQLLDRRPRGRPRRPEELRPGQARDQEKRLRLGVSLEQMRSMVPGMGKKADKTAVTMLAAQYVLFLKKQVGIEFDEEFKRALAKWTTVVTVTNAPMNEESRESKTMVTLSP